MSQEIDPKRLLNDAIAAAREGDKDRARLLLEEVVAADPQNEKAWYWLASVAETDEQRRLYLGNVIQINPNNERAQAILARLETRQEEKPKSGLDEELMPGVTKRLVIIGGASVAILAVLICAALAIAISSNQQAAANQQATARALQGTQDAVLAQAQTAEFQATQAVLLGLVTATPAGPTLPPTWTAQPSPTSALGITATPLPTALANPMFSGRIAAASGDDLLGEGFVPIVEFGLDGSPGRTLVDGRGRAPSFSPQGDLMIYTRYSSGTREQGLEIITLNGTVPPRLLTQLLGGRVLVGQDEGSFSPDGNSVTFMAKEPGSTNHNIYVLSLQALGGVAGNQQVPEEIAAQALTRITDGSINSISPTWADSTRLVYVADSSATGGGADLRILGLNGTQTNITSDAAGIFENHPDVSPDGTWVAFDGYTTDPNDTDIYMVSMNGGVSMLLVDTPAKEVRPRWSPDGRFLVYSSNRTGSWEIYIVEVATYASYQVTVNSIYDQANAWLP